MVLIDSPTDLMATASRHFPASSADSTSFQNWETDYDYYDGRDYQDEPRLSLSDLYLKGAYEKRVQDLEAFAKDKNFWASYNGLQKKDKPGRTRIAASKRRRVSQRRQDFAEQPSNIKGNNAGGVYDYVDPLSFSDIYGSPSSYTEDYYGPQKQPPPPQPLSLTRRVSNAIFNPVSGTIFSIVAVPLMLAAVYWLFVVNGPTPVVKARIEDFEAIEESQQQRDDLTRLLFDILKTYFIPVIQQET